jgi:4-hydroxymandelate oxidase
MKYNEILERATENLKELNIYDAIFHYGTETGYTRITNSGFFKTIALKLRTLDAKPADTKTKLFGQEILTPIIAGAMSNPRIKGMKDPLSEWAEGVKAAGTIMGVGTSASDEFRKVVGTGVPTYRISKPFKDRRKIYSEIEEAEEGGAIAVGVDIDFAQGGKSGEKTFFSEEVAPLSSEELADLIRESKLPFVVKGILHEDDAGKALKAGAKAIVVSNHRAMVLDSCAHALEVLPSIKKVVGQDLTLLADGGFMRGGDVLKALALGADGVLVGQALLLALVAGKAEAVRDMILEMTAQLQRAMTLTGCLDVHSIDKSILVTRNLIF